MWRTVMKLEWRILRKERSTFWILGLFSFCLMFAAISSGRHATQLANAMQHSQEAETTRYTEAAVKIDTLTNAKNPLQSKDPRNPQYMGSEGAARIAILPPAPLAAMAVGQRDLLPQAVKVTSGIEIAADRETETPMIGPTRLATGPFDPAFLFVFLFPLVVIALSYELLAGERERGTLAMLLSQPVTQRQLVLGKAGARATLLILVGLIFTLVGLLFAGAELSSATAWIHVSLLAMMILAWGLFWFAAAIFVNSKGRSSAGNALSLVGLWLLLVIVVPGFVQVAVDIIHPPPSKVEFLHEVREATQEAKQKLDGIQGRHDVDQTTQDYAKRVTTMQKELATKMEPMSKVMRKQQSDRQSFLSLLQFLSPAVVVQLAVEDIAGSGNLRHNRFELQVEQYHDRYRAFFFSKIEQDQRLESQDLKAIPKFDFIEESNFDLGSRALFGALWLLLLSTLLVGLALRGLRSIGRLS
ncbi:MAG: hypothetical protein CMH56_02615 [Myxococcales bacterium]|nr:hypothetical protein [Myxococcales bacterium]|tara:strand:+ start:621 stop:2033 length:1413 start_codon:yes stop_codon:yes gene_type:complete